MFSPARVCCASVGLVLVMALHAIPGRAAQPRKVPHLIGLRVESPAHTIGVKGEIHLKVIGHYSDGSSRTLAPKEARLSVRPKNAARTLSHHRLYGSRAGHIQVIAHAGKLQSKPLHLDVQPH